MSEDIWVDFQTCLIEVEGGYSAAILFNGQLIQDTTVYKTKSKAKKRVKKLVGLFIEATERAGRDIGMTIDTVTIKA